MADHTICSVRNLPALHFFAQFLKEKEQTRSLYQCGSSTCETTTFGSHPLVYFKVSFCKTQPKNTTWKVSFWCFFLTFWKTRVGVFNIFWSLGSAYGVCPTQFVTMEPDIWEKQKAFMLCLFASSQFLALLLSSGNWEITIQTTPHVLRKVSEIKTDILRLGWPMYQNQKFPKNIDIFWTLQQQHQAWE